MSFARDRVQQLLVPSSSPTLFLMGLITWMSTYPSLPSGSSLVTPMARPSFGTGALVLRNGSLDWQGPECRDFSQHFLRAPGIWQSLVQCLFSTCLARGLQESWISPGDYLLRLLFYGSSMCKAGFTGYDALRAVFLSVRMPMILGIKAVWTGRTVAGIAGFHALRALFPGS